MRTAARRFQNVHQAIGFVPTMGCLHKGHLSLVRAARRAADIVVVSIFVNPAQFGPKEDFTKYPRTLAKDLSHCRSEGVDIVFCPSVREMYGRTDGFHVDGEKLTSGLCGKFRHGHFRGVMTVVAKLFNIVRPDVAVFGQKDIQQARIIQEMVKDLNFPVRVKISPTVREQDGLAMSSRNRYLSAEQRRNAVCLHKALMTAAKMIRKGETDTVRIKSAIKRIACGEGGAKLQYVEVVSFDSLKALRRVSGRTVIALAAFIGKTRLIDNIILKCGR